MVVFTFRAKLLLAMMVTVGAITGGTLWVTQHRVENAYAAFFRQQFLAQVGSFSQIQELTIGNLKEQCLLFARSVRVIAAMSNILDERDEDAKKDMYANARILLGEKTGKSARITVLNSNGKVLTLANSGEGIQLEGLRLSLKEASTQEIGYLPSGSEETDDALQDLILTKIVDPDNEQLLGAIIVGLPFPKFSGKPGRSLRTGIWLGNRLYESGLDKTEHTQLTQQLSGTSESIIYLKAQPFLFFKQSLNPKGIFPEAWQICLYSLKESIDEQRALRRSILSFGAAGLLAALILSLFLSQGLTAPIQDLVRGTKEIEEGRYDVKVAIRARDEMGQLAASFNQMAEGLALKEKYRSVLNLVADKEIADDLLQGKIALGGEVREITVLFCDIRGFTAITQNMDPREVIQLLNEHFTPLTQVVYDHHGVVDKFVGDLIMALFGAPKSFGNDASNAVACAIKMMHEREKLNAVSKRQISIGIGIATGKVIAGRMGSADRLNYSVLGERVNLASRLCGQAAPMEIIIDERTREKLGAEVPVQPVPDLLLKGFANPVTAYKLILT